MGLAVEVLGLVARDHVVERVVGVDAERDFSSGSRELLGDRRVCILCDRRKRLRERVAGAQRRGDRDQRVRQLRLERVQPLLRLARPPPTFLEVVTLIGDCK